MNTAYGYCRVSTGDQAMSLQAQKDTIDRYYQGLLASKGFTWGGWFMDENVSGKVPLWDRPEGAKLRMAVDTGDTILMSKLDRGFRRLADLVIVIDALSGRGVHLQLLDLGIDTTTDVGRLMVRIMGAFAEWERDRICERHRDTKAMRKRLGLAICGGQPPYGFKRVKKRCEATGQQEWHLERSEAERAIGAAIVQFRDQGWAWQLIADHLNTHKIFLRGNRKWIWARVVTIRKRELALREAEAKGEGDVAIG